MDIPQDLTDIDFKAYSFNDNHTKVWDFNPCSFDFIIWDWEDKFNFSSGNLISLRNNETLHMVLDWAIGNETMKVAQNKANFACGGNSTRSIDLNPNNVSNNLSTKIIGKTFHKTHWLSPPSSGSWKAQILIVYIWKNLCPYQKLRKCFDWKHFKMKQINGFLISLASRCF